MHLQPKGPQLLAARKALFLIPAWVKPRALTAIPGPSALRCAAQRACRGRNSTPRGRAADCASRGLEVGEEARGVGYPVGRLVRQ